MLYRPLSVDISGAWSPRQARAIIEGLRAETDARGITLKMITKTMINDRPHHVIIQVFCARHDRPVLEDSACELCILESRTPGSV